LDLGGSTAGEEKHVLLKVDCAGDKEHAPHHICASKVEDDQHLQKKERKKRLKREREPGQQGVQTAGGIDESSSFSSFVCRVTCIWWHD